MTFVLYRPPEFGYALAALSTCLPVLHQETRVDKQEALQEKHHRQSPAGKRNTVIVRLGPDRVRDRLFSSRGGANTHRGREQHHSHCQTEGVLIAATHE